MNKKGGKLCRIYMQRTVDRRQCIMFKGLAGTVRIKSCLCGVISNRMCYLAILVECVVSWRVAMEPSLLQASARCKMLTMNQLNLLVDCVAHISQGTGQMCCL